jgi:hypothetical protein
MTEAEMSAAVEAELTAAVERELQAQMAKRRADIAARLRHEAAMAHLDRVNARRPIEGPGDPKVEAERLRIMDAAAKAANAHMDKINARPTPGAVVRGLRPARAGGAGGGAGFRVKSGVTW